MSTLKSLIRCLLPDWLFITEPDAHHAHRRRYTDNYRRKRQCVKSLWIGSGILMIALGSAPAYVVILALATTFASFCILDETS